jgi:hypothetical protein
MCGCQGVYLCGSERASASDTSKSRLAEECMASDDLLNPKPYTSQGRYPKPYTLNPIPVRTDWLKMAWSAIRALASIFFAAHSGE